MTTPSVHITINMLNLWDLVLVPVHYLFPFVNIFCNLCIVSANLNNYMECFYCFACFTLLFHSNHSGGTLDQQLCASHGDW